MRDLPRLMLAAPASGSGKTTLTIALLRALLDRRVRPSAFKCGPDYIDPMFHRHVLGVPGRNLDLFFTSPEIVRGLLLAGAGRSDVALMEGVMGFYDGVADTTRASSWHLAVETETPAVLALRPGGASLSLAALINGFAAFRENSMLRGVVLTRCSRKRYDKLAPMLERETGLTLFGHVPDMPDAVLESRHLGLVTPDGVDSLREKVGRLADRVAETVNVDGLLELARTALPLRGELPALRPVSDSPVRIAVARDEAFCFYYEENLELLRTLGADLAFFSPLRDASLPEGVRGLYLGGGYPELHAAALAENAAMRAAVADFVRSGAPTVAECGGFLYLHAELEDGAGRSHPMVGVFPGTARNGGALRRFGYVGLTALRDNILCACGDEIGAHEFHYWDCDDPGDAFAARKAGGEEWRCVKAEGGLFAGFPHLYFWSNPAFAKRFVKAAAGRARG